MSDFLLTFSLLAMLVVGGVLGGIGLAKWREERRTRVLDKREARIQAEWEALITAQRLHAGYLAARQALYTEAMRHGQGGQI